MFTKNRIGLIVASLAITVLALAACQPQIQEVVVTRIVTETVTEEGETVEVTRVVTETETITEEGETVVVTATPEPVEEVTYSAPDPETVVIMTFGDIDTLDPALAYDTASGDPIQHMLETLIWYNHRDGTTYVPVLAEEVPTAENGGISEDGLTYTFNIREGVTFHDGGTLEPSDVAYSFQRGLLQSDPHSAQWLLLEPILGYQSGDVTEEIADGEYGGDPEGLIANASAEELVALCENVKSHVVADNDAGTVTFNNTLPWGPFLATIAQSWGSILDQEWTAAQGDWDGSCETWQNFYSPGSENSKLTSVINGTGPFMMDHWTPGEEWVMTANENYWRTEPRWDGDPVGPPVVKTIITQDVVEWGTRFAALQAGDATWVSVPSENETQVDALVGEFCDWATGDCTVNEDNPNGQLRKFDGLPSVARTDAFLVWNIAEDSPFIGSGQLDGNGIPPDFFSDINVRKAMATCMDYETYIQDIQLGKGFRNNGPIIKDMLGYNPDGAMYEYDPDACAAYFEEAWDGVLPETGFRFQIAFNAGNTGRQGVAEIFQGEISSINPNYQVETVGLPWPTFLRSIRATQLPVYVSGWIEDIHDPHNWAQPFTVGTYAGRAGVPEEEIAKFEPLVNAGALEADPAVREQIYFDLQELYHDDAVAVTLSQRSGFRFENRFLNGYYFRVGQFATDKYGLSQD